MKIAFVKQKYVPFGGGEGYLHRLLTACVQHGHDPHLITTSWPGHAATEFSVHTVKHQRHSRTARIRSFSTAVSQYIKTQCFNLVFSLDRTAEQDIWRSGEGVHRIWLDRRKAFEPEWHVRISEYMGGHQALLDLEKNAVENTPCIIANSAMVKNDIAKVYGKHAEKVSVIYNGLNPDRFDWKDWKFYRAKLRTEFHIAPHECVLLFIGSGFLRKGLLETLNTIHFFPNIRLIVFGRDPQVRWKKEVRKRNLQQRVIFAGTRENVSDLYQGADMAVLPSWFDPFPNAGLEALYCGTPLITTRYTGTHELIQSGDTGYILDTPADIEQFRTAIEYMLNKKKNNDYAEHIHNSVKEYTMEHNFNETLKLIEKFHN